MASKIKPEKKITSQEQKHKDTKIRGKRKVGEQTLETWLVDNSSLTKRKRDGKGIDEN